MDKPTPLENALAAKLQRLLPDENAPPEVKDEVFRTIELLDLVGSVADLFTAKFAATGTTFLDLSGDADLADFDTPEK